MDNPVKLYVPKQVAHPCGFCPRMIVLGKTEEKNTIYVSGHKPICVVCRVLRGKKGTQILYDKARHERDEAERKRAAEEKELNRIAQIAHESQQSSEKIQDLPNSEKKRFNV